jgi:hypothetical protein
MGAIERAFTSLVDQLNPFSLGNLIFYFTWLTLYTFSLVAVWRSHRSWIRLICLVLNQILSIGVLMSYSLTLLLAYNYWLPSALIFLGVASMTFVLFRKRSGERPSPPADRVSPPGDRPSPRTDRTRQ